MLKRALRNLLTTIAGAVAGVPEIIQGINTGSVGDIIQGAGIFLMGLFAKDIFSKKPQE